MAKINLLLEDYIAELRVGVHAAERATAQRVRVSVTAQLKQAPDADDLSQTYDYTQMISVIMALSETHVDLLETFAVQLANQLLADSKLSRVEVELVKLDILENGRVGVRYAASK